MESFVKVYNRVKPFLIVILMQCGYAGMAVIGKFALNNGMSHYTLVVYRHTIAAIVISPFAMVLERKVRPRMTASVFIKILLLGLLEPVIDQNLYYMAMKKTTATFTAAMCNIVPAITFVMAWVFRLEKVNMRRMDGQAKVVGTVVAVGGAMLMTLIRGPVIPLPWVAASHHHAAAAAGNYEAAAASHQHPIKGALMITVGCISWSSFIILQSITLKTYRAELSLAVWICVAGAVEGAVLTVAVERGNAAIWSLHSTSEVLAVLYGGILVSGIGYFVQGALIKERGPVFVTAFSPLSMVFVAIMGSFLLGEQTFLGRVIGAVVIVVGLYVVVWGKSKDNRPSQSDSELVMVQQPKTTMMDDNTGASTLQFVAVEVGRVDPCLK